MVDSCYVGRYELGPTLSAGNFCMIKLARDVNTGYTVAIKMLHKTLICNQIMGVTNSRSLTELEARKYFQQLICAVAFCHSRGVSHGNLKPENLLLDAKGVLKVSDFGMRPLFQQVPVASITCYEGAQADIWSCGVILFVLLAGYLPFNDKDIYLKRCQADFTCPSFFSPSVTRLIKRTLDPCPATRITIDEILEDEWFNNEHQPTRSFQENISSDKDSKNVVGEGQDAGPSASVTRNAFKKSLHLSLVRNLFNKALAKRETSFISKCSANEIVSGIENRAASMGFNIKKRNYKLRIEGERAQRKGHLSICTKISEADPPFHTVEIRKTGGHTLEFDNFCKDLSAGLQDIIWKEEPVNTEKDEMREEVISSGGTLDPTPAASSAGASSPAVPNVGSIDGSSHGQASKAASLSCVGSQPPWTSLSTSAGGSAFGSSRSSCRPWERGDLLRRLATFIPSNWLGKPQIISSLACAQKGWMNNGVDKIACESCGSCLSFTALPSWTSAEAQNASKSFARQLDLDHKVNCPWKGNSCPESLVQFPPTPPSALIGGYKDRCDGLVQFHCLPVVAISAIELMSVSCGPQIERFLSQSQNFMSGEVDIKPDIISELQNSQDEAYCLYSRAQKLISLCGWESSWLLNIQDCEEHSAQSERNGYSLGPSKTQLHLTQDPGSKAVSASTKLDARKAKAPLKESRLDSRLPLLDCSLCGATVRISDFLTVPRPARFASNSIDIPDSSKKIGLTRGASAASGINGWIAADDTEKDQTEDRDEVATTNEGKLLANTDLDLNLTMAGGFPFTPLSRTATSEYTHDDMGRDLMIGQPSGSEIGDRAASYESRGPSCRKRNLEKGGCSDNRPVLRLQQQADSVEGIVIDRDGDEVTDGGQYSAGPSKRARDSDIFDTYCSPLRRDSSGAGPSHSIGLEAYATGNRISSYHQGSDRPMGIQSARDSTRASSVIAMDTICHSVNDDSMESVENYPGDLDDVHFPSSSIYGNVEMNETSELNNSNQAQQSTCLQTATEVARGDVGVSSTNYGEELFNAETVTAQARDGISLGISGGSVGMCASHEAEIHGVDISVHRADSVVGEMEQRVEDAENQGQTGESVPDPGLLDEIIPDMNREDPIGDSQEMMSHTAGRTDSGSKIGCSTKAESVESGEKISQNCNLLPANSSHPSHSCNANIYSGCENTKEGLMKDGKSSFANNHALPKSDFAIANGIGPPKGESNYEAAEFDPIVHHNQCCPWVNGNVAVAGCASSVPSSSNDAIALCGWQLTLDALDALSLGHNAIPTVPSESAASLYKQNDQQAPGQKLFHNHSMSQSHGQL
ncbi:hypothetical protein JHK87_012866 [Glycine soja]|nr:hypothetical protein JHK87_012866 [Glycine soja]